LKELRYLKFYVIFGRATLRQNFVVAIGRAAHEARTEHKEIQEKYVKILE
jgi:hypothetical protein